MNILKIIQGLSIATVILLARLPAYGASVYLAAPKAQLDDDPILDIAGYIGETIHFRPVFDTTGLTTNLEFISINIRFDSNEISGLDFNVTDDDKKFFPNTDFTLGVDPNTGLSSITSFRSGPPGLPPNTVHEIADVYITLGPQLNNDGKVDYEAFVVSAIDVNGKDITNLFKNDARPTASVDEFEVQAVPEPSNIFALVLAVGFGAFLRKQNRKVLRRI
ncbi:PEP-CTERM sorting domain-containing protein [Nostoc sp. UHCC 0702]|nr:PEP-CTERM sorting domain-containing protein [Nostoc sp. UHCC 0702]